MLKEHHLEVLAKLPKLIHNFNEDVIFENRPDAFKPLYCWHHHVKPFQKIYRKDIHGLLHVLFHDNYITETQKENLTKQFESPDRENWLVAFMFIDMIRKTKINGIQQKCLY